MADDIEALKAKYESRLKSSFSEEDDKDAVGKNPSQGKKGLQENAPLVSSDYAHFKNDNLPAHLTTYEKLCNMSEKILSIGPDKKAVADLDESIKICHLQITPTGIISFSVLFPIVLALLIIFVAYVLPSVFFGGGSTFFVLFAIFSALIVIIPLQKLPNFLANNWRMKASNQMVLAVFYIVTYMRHTSNIERAMSFAAEHLAPPLSLDLKKVIWDVESEKFGSIKESLDDYLLSWRKYNLEFVESMHLIESSLYEVSEGRRLDALDKSLKVILDETYEKMLHFAHNLKGPLTALHMLGIILPILGLVILPLLVSFVSDVRWYHIAVLYNLVLPVVVFYLAKSILSTRPTGYGESDIAETNPELRKYRDIIIPIGRSELRISPLIIAAVVFGLLLFIGSLPLIIHYLNPGFDIVMTSSYEMRSIDGTTDPEATYHLLGYRYEIVNGKTTDNLIGPFGVGSLILSTVFVLAFGIGIGLYYVLRSKNVIKIREQSKALEQEFASALFQLGNRLGDGLPAEIAFGKVAVVMEGTLSGRFFEMVSNNIVKRGMGVEQAIFDPKLGAIAFFPSNLIESSMKVLVESSKKGPMIASQALINVSEYIKQIHRVDERLKDLMADIISDMKSQVRFLTPAIAGIVVGITSMIVQIIGSLADRFGELAADAESANIGATAGLMGMFGTGVPTYHFQIIVGLYVVQITFILSILINGIENGSDKLSERYIIGNNMVKTTITYIIITLAVSLLFSIVAGSILGNMGSPA